MDEILVSIIVPIYNKENTIEKCVDTLKNQSYTNIEIILVNDGSTDNSLSVCKNIAQGDERIQIVDQLNEGVSVARNTGINMSKGDFIAFVDPDDWVSFEYIELLLNTALYNKSEIVICDAKIVFNQNTIKKNKFFSTEGEIDKVRCISQLIYNNEYYDDDPAIVSIGVPWAKLYKSSLIKGNNIRFRKELRRNQDNIFNLYAHQFANKVTYFNQYLYYYDYDNINNFSRKITKDASELYTSLSKETFNFYKNYYEDNLEVYNLVQNKVIKNLTYILTKKICHPQYNKTLKERKKEIKEIVDEFPFFEVLKLSKREHFYGNNKLIYTLLNIKAYYLILCIFLSRNYLLNRDSVN